jgi:hypothetical protein
MDVTVKLLTIFRFLPPPFDILMENKTKLTILKGFNIIE